MSQEIQNSEEISSLALSEDLRQQAQNAFIQGDMAQAMELIQKASQTEPTNFKIHLDLVQMYIQTGHLDKAQDLFNKLPDEAKESEEGKPLAGFLTFANSAQQAGDIQEIQKTLQENPNDPAALYGFASILVIHHEYEKALQTLLKLFSVAREYKEGLAQKSLIQLFEQLNSSQPELVKAYRRKLQNLLY